MTLAARLEDFEVTLEHLLMDVFVSRGFHSRCRGVPSVTPTVPGAVPTGSGSRGAEGSVPCHGVGRRGAS